MLKILVLGDVILDQYVSGKASRLSQEAPVPVVAVQERKYVLGGAANVAANLKEIGVDICLLGVVGDDRWSSIVFELLHEKNIPHVLIKSNMPTIVKTRVISDDQHLVRYDVEKSYASSSQDVVNAIKNLPNQFDAVIISDYSKGSISLDVVDAVRQQFACKIFADIKPEHKDWYKGVFCITPNINEAKKMSQRVDLIDIAKDIKAELQLHSIVVTMSEDGILYVAEDNAVYRCPAYKRSVVERHHRKDVSGAGDTLISVLAWSIASGHDELTSVVMSNMAAAIVVDKLGTSTCPHKELEEELKHEPNLVAQLIRVA